MKAIDPDTFAAQLDSSGLTIVPTGLAENDLQALRDSIFTTRGAGQRCLLDQLIVQKAAGALQIQLVQLGILPETAIAIQAIAFDKTRETNWKVTWHQDLMFPFAQPVTTKGYDLPSVKEGVDYARPPRDVLEDLLAVRLHLDDCDETNGPLRVAPGSHRCGVLKSSEISGVVEQHGAVICRAKTGEVLLMRPLLLHASSVATAPKHRRVLHLVYHSGTPTAEPWHRCVQARSKA